MKMQSRRKALGRAASSRAQLRAPLAATLRPVLATMDASKSALLASLRSEDGLPSPFQFAGSFAEAIRRSRVTRT